MIKTIKENNEVLYSKDGFIHLDSKELNDLKELAMLNPSSKIRLCTHLSPKDVIHEMIIYHPKGTYVHPHKHLGRAESFYLISGAIDCIIFDDIGNIEKNFSMGDFSSGKIFYYRMPSNTYHTQLFKKDTFFHEVTMGPFTNTDTIKAEWAPREDDATKVKSYINNINNLIKL